MAAPLPSGIVPDLPRRGTNYGPAMQSVLNASVIAVMALAALSVAFGYRVNLRARSVAASGTVELDSPQRLQADAAVNGREVGGLPYRDGQAVPGSYALEVRSTGLQTWAVRTKVTADRRADFNDIYLFAVQPEKLGRREQLAALSGGERAGLTVRHGNELWVDGKFVQRVGGELRDPQWFVRGTHVVTQRGSDLVVFDLKAGISFIVLQLATDAPVAFVPQSARFVAVDEGDPLGAAVYDVAPSKGLLP